MPVCPQCGSTASKEAKDEPGQFSFTVVARRECKDCGHCYEPPMPWWGGLALLIAAPILLVSAVAIPIFALVSGGVIHIGGLIIVTLLLGTLGFMSLIKGIAVMRGDKSISIGNPGEVMSYVLYGAPPSKDSHE